MSTPTTASEEADQPQPEPLRWRPDDLIGRGRFRLVRFIAKGGMGIVWEAFDQKLHERVAVKTIPPDLRSNHPAFDHLRREIVRNRALSHPNIVRIHDLHEEEGEEPFIVMELVDGRGLDEWQREQADGIFDWEWLRPFLLQVCDALAYAHQRNIIHRDLKPANILLCRDGQIKIIDFGLATKFHDALHPMSRSLAASGTTAYMSPQQVEGWPSTAQDDIYALGATLFEMLAGQPPFVGGDLAHQVANVAPQKLQERLDERGVQVSIPDEAENFVSACLTKDTATRPKSVESLIQTLTGAIPVGTPPPSSLEPEPPLEESSAEMPAREPRRHRLALQIMGAATLVSCVAVALLLFKKPSPPSLKDTSTPSSTSVGSIEELAERHRVEQRELQQRQMEQRRAETRKIPEWQRYQEEFYETRFQLGGSVGASPFSVEVTRQPRPGNPSQTVFKNTVALGPGKWSLNDNILSVVLDGSNASTYLVAGAESSGWGMSVMGEGVKMWFGLRQIQQTGPNQPGRAKISLADSGVVIGAGPREWQSTSTLWEWHLPRLTTHPGVVRAPIPPPAVNQDPDLENLRGQPWLEPSAAWTRTSAVTGQSGSHDIDLSSWCPVRFWNTPQGPYEHALEVGIHGRISVPQLGGLGRRSPSPMNQNAGLDFRRVLIKILRTGHEPATVKFKDMAP